MAESLRAVRVPAATLLTPGPVAPPGTVLAALLHTLAPPEAPDEPPPTLRPRQALAFRRVLAALRRHGGVLLADPVGSGKTHVALAAAAAAAPQPVTCLVPPGLAGHWRRVAGDMGVAVVTWSHQLLSRGRAPPDAPGAVVVDESHHFRNPATRRHAVAARWLRGRPSILVSATPVVNHAGDLVHQLLLAVRDDALRRHGIGSLRQAARTGAGLEVLGHLIVAGEDAGGPAVERRTLPVVLDAQSRRLLEGLERLRYSREPAIAALVRQVFVRALASSPEALGAALRRYRLLLLQARDAAACGRTLPREALRRLAGPDTAQVVLWQLLPGDGDTLELALDDLDGLPALECAAAEPSTDERRAHLARLSEDGAPTVVFTVARETMAALRRLRPSAAWCCGDAAGIGHVRMARAEVLAPFERAEGPREREPHLLLATDVASEGLNLRGVRRVVHWDLPWTPARMAQRAGRARRLDSTWSAVEEVGFLLPAEFETRLELLRRLREKDEAWQQALVRPPWRWRAAIAGARAGAPTPGMATLRGASLAGVLAAVRFLAWHERGREALDGWVGWWDGAAWREDSVTIGRALAEVHRLRPGTPVPPPAVAMLELGRVAAGRLAALRESTLGPPSSLPVVRHLRRRLLRLAEEAHRERNAETLVALERGLRWLERQGSAGDALEAGRLLHLPVGELRGALASLPAPERPASPPVAELTALLVLLPGPSRLPSTDGALSLHALRP